MFDEYDIYKDGIFWKCCIELKDLKVGDTVNLGLGVYALVDSIDSEGIHCTSQVRFENCKYRLVRCDEAIS